MTEKTLDIKCQKCGNWFVISIGEYLTLKPSMCDDCINEAHDRYMFGEVGTMPSKIKLLCHRCYGSFTVSVEEYRTLKALICQDCINEELDMFDE